MASDKLREFSTRIGVMSLRERVFVFAAAAVVVLALVQTLLIDGSQLRQQQAQARLKSADAMLITIGQQQQLFASQAGLDPDRAVRAALAEQEARLAELNVELEARTRSLVQPERMNQVLKNIVQGQAGIRVVGFNTLTPEPVALPDADKGAPPGFYRHGFEIVVSGRYADLVAYLERMEALPWRLNWIEANLDAATRPELTLTLTVHTLSLEEAWLRV